MLFRQFGRCVLVLAGLLWLSGCTPAPPPATEWQLHQKTLESLTRFQARGKVAFIGATQRLSANFLWQQDGDTVSLRLTNFLGSTLLTLETTPGRAVLTDNEGVRHVGANANGLLTRLTGVALPVNALPLWLKGLPSAQDGYKLGADDRLASLDQDASKKGWLLDYQRYHGDTAPALPEKIKMTKDKQKVNLVITDWIVSE